MPAGTTVELAGFDGASWYDDSSEPKIAPSLVLGVLLAGSLAFWAALVWALFAILG